MKIVGAWFASLVVGYPLALFVAWLLMDMFFYKEYHDPASMLLFGYLIEVVFLAPFYAAIHTVVFILVRWTKVQLVTVSFLAVCINVLIFDSPVIYRAIVGGGRYVWSWS